MDKTIQKNGLINLLVLLGVGVAALAVARYANSLGGQVGSLYLGLGVLVAAVSWFQMHLEQRERLEKLELEELAKGRSGSALFEAKDAELFPAQRSREQFERFFVPGFTVLLFVLQAGGAFLLWRWLSRATTVTEVRQPITGLALFGLFALVLFLLGRFSATVARLEHHRLLRPGASYLLCNAVLCLVVALGLVAVWAGFPKADLYVAHALCALLALLALETLIQLVLEIYRPRLKGKVGRPLYESRLVGLLGQPEGLVTTAAQALDYQFGFKVSETWFYRFFAKALGWIILLQVGALLLSTAVVFIDAGEQALLERLGKLVESRSPLGPGAHLKWPWPIDRVYRFRTEQIQTFTVGFAPGTEIERERYLLWSRGHKAETNFLVANREQLTQAVTNLVTGKRTPPVSLLTVGVPVHFEVTNLVQWAYNHENAPALLEDLSTREVVRYLVGVDMGEIMSRGREEAGRALRSRIQTAADGRRLGARIVSVGVGDLHPPVNVVPEYEKVVSANQTKQAKILAARADDIRTNALALAQAVTLTNTASAERLAREVGALAEAALFTNQIPAFKAAPSVYPERAYLQTFVRATANARKYVLLTTNTQDVIVFDLQESVAESLLNLKVPAPKPQ
ncbi:MAG TPA: SPFH domain-containing protein [Candidatus Paceibacterota bacterium]|nr:SPFH domain-containing protein [Verrucomicrobiota bacterium]HSA10732.1 SPFH domain-containing protein [Candidatus Paceibacterota bacterium]